MSTCKTITYTSPSDSYDELCGAPATETWEGKPCCTRHYRFFKKLAKERRSRAFRELEQRMKTHG